MNRVSAEFSIQIYQFPSEKGGWITLTIPFPFPETRSPFPASFVPPINPPLLLLPRLFSLSQQIWSEGRIGSIRSRNLALFDIETHVRTTHCAA